MNTMNKVDYFGCSWFGYNQNRFLKVNKKGQELSTIEVNCFFA